MVIDEMMKEIFKLKNGTILDITWERLNLHIKGKIDTVYESCNCLEEDDPNYKEYYACCVEIIKVIKSNETFQKKEGDFIEISVDNQPSKIELENGTIIWPCDDRQIDENQSTLSI